MARHHADATMCRKLAGASVGKLCSLHDGCCPVCDSYVRPAVKAKICDDCNYGETQNRCIICAYHGATNDAYYCKECVLQEKDRDGCPRVTNQGMEKLDNIYNKRANPNPF